jgi:hypothetical protein
MGLRVAGYDLYSNKIVDTLPPSIQLLELGRNLYSICISSCMKRINPDTKSPFKYGDIRADGKVFYNYRSDTLLSGYQGERWLSPEKFKLAETRDRFNKHKKRRQDGKPIRMTRGKRERLKETRV